MKTAADILTEEHKVILKVVHASNSLAEMLENGEAVPPETLLGIVEFAQQFVDGYHHHKEEDILFPALEKAGNKAINCRLKALRDEHQFGRKLISQLAQSIKDYVENKPGSRKTVMDSLLSIPRLYPGHMYREDTIVFPMIKEMLGKDQQDALVSKFEEIEKEIGNEFHQRYIEYARRIANDISQHTKLKR